jgi:hypothetical protein
MVRGSRSSVLIAAVSAVMRSAHVARMISGHDVQGSTRLLRMQAVGDAIA